MAKLRDIKYKKVGKNGDVLEFSSSVTVDSAGIFCVSLPAELVELSGVKGINTVVSHGAVRLVGPRLEELEQALGGLVTEYLSCETSEELVILYDYRATCHYVKSPSGDLYPNGSFCEGYKWNTAVGRSTVMDHESTPLDYSVGFKARVMLKRVHTRISTSKVEYAPANSSDLGEFGKLLNAFVKVSFKNAKELPYTEQRARVFYESMLGLCHISDQLDTLLKDPENLLKGNVQYLLGGGK